MNLFSDIYKNKKVFLTGHTGFKGSWLAMWLQELGAEVLGYSLEAPSDPSHFKLLSLDYQSVIGDIRDLDKITKTMTEFKPDIIFHLAAQPLVRYSYDEPIETYETNVIGTLKVFEAARQTKSVQAIINVTTDKCYENKEWAWGYRENEPMGGYDPYSSSKGCSELLTSSYRNSYFNIDEFGSKHNVLIASARAGNVIGGGDWAQDRLLPDMMVSASLNKPAVIRSPNATRPWQHVLEPLSGYLHLGQKLLERKTEFSTAFNFGPSDEDITTVESVVKKGTALWDQFTYDIQENPENVHEAKLLKLDSSKAKEMLDWESVWSCDVAIEKTVLWYKEYYYNKSLNSGQDLKDFTLKMKN